MSGFSRVASMIAKKIDLAISDKPVNETDTEKFSAAIAGNGHADDNSKSSNASDDRSIFESLTDWHFEGREELNSNLPSYKEADADPAWQLLEPEQSIFHDNGIGRPELKFIHEDGREVVFDGDTHEIILDPELIGTYNYVNPAPMPDEWYDICGWLDWGGKGIGHFFADILPYGFGGNVRGDDDALSDAFTDQYDYDIDWGGGFGAVDDNSYDIDYGGGFEAIDDNSYDIDYGGGFEAVYDNSYDIDYGGGFEAIDDNSYDIDWGDGFECCDDYWY